MRNVAIALGIWLAGLDTPDPETVGVRRRPEEDGTHRALGWRRHRDPHLVTKSAAVHPSMIGGGHP